MCKNNISETVHNVVIADKINHLSTAESSLSNDFFFFFEMFLKTKILRSSRYFLVILNLFLFSTWQKKKTY